MLGVYLMIIKVHVYYFFIKAHIVCAHLNHLVEAIQMSTHNIGFYEDLTKIIFQLSSNTLSVLSE